MFDLLWLIPLLPLAGFLTITFGGSRLPSAAAAVIGVGSVSVSAVLSFLLGGTFLLHPPEGDAHVQFLWTWMLVGDFAPSVAFRLDALSIVMLWVITGVGALIHLYSVEYMRGDQAFKRFFAYMNLFVCMMLILVLADNLLLLYLGWEGVGLCSYLLIGFWSEDPSNGAAARKAFIVTRVGDTAMALGLFLLATELGTLDIQTAMARAVERWPVGSNLAVATALLLLIGALGKSAQLPLHTWLPDAMAGPTPVSALIHAATMVTAGVYMVARANILYTLAPAAATVVASVGALTALYAATIGLTQFDIKRVLAYSTISQLGYMFIGVGVGAFAAGIFHLMTHAFFKALLFMAAGSVMHALSNETDMRRMGGLKDKMPRTFWTMLLATLAIAGIPGFSGFFSKDEILWQAWSGVHGAPWLWLIGAVAAALTTFYMFRLIFMTFSGTLRADAQTAHHVHESPGVMTWPLIILAILSVGGGWIGIPAVLGGGQHFEHFLAPVFAASTTIQDGAAASPAEAGHGLELMLMGIVLLAVLASLWLAWRFYGRKSDLPERTAKRLGGLYTLVFNKYYIDELYDAAITRPLRRFSESALWRFIDTRVIDGSLNGVAALIGAGSRALSSVQTGMVQNYALLFVFGVVALLFYLLF